MDHLMLEKVRLILSSVRILKFKVWVFMIVFDYDWSDFGENVFFIENSRCPQVWCF